MGVRSQEVVGVRYGVCEMGERWKCGMIGVYCGDDI